MNQLIEDPVENEESYFESILLNTGELRPEHEEFSTLFYENKIDYILPKRFIKVFYKIPNTQTKQIIVQLLLVVMWAIIILGIILLFKKMWIYSALSFVGSWVIKQWINVFVLKAIKKWILNDSKIYNYLMDNKLIILRKN